MEEREGTATKRRKIYVPKDRELRTKIIYLYHNIPVAGNKG